MNSAGRYVFSVVLLFVMGLLGSCLGLSSEIAMNRDGSGTITLEYRISRMVESLGKLDGNERWLPLPVGEADFERTVARVEGLTMDSFSSKIDGEDLINRVKLAFANPQALVRFLDARGAAGGDTTGDAAGRRASWEGGPGGNRLVLSLGGGAEVGDPELLDLAAALAEGYTLHFGLSLPGDAAVSLRDSRGGVPEKPPAGTLESRGGRVVFSSPMADMLRSPEAVILDIRW